MRQFQYDYSLVFSDLGTDVTAKYTHALKKIEFTSRKNCMLENVL
jgi:hypothetical protein